MRRSVSRTLSVVGAAVCVLLSTTGAAASATGAPPDTDAGRDNAALAQFVKDVTGLGFGQVVSPVAQAGLVDEGTLAALQISPPGK